MNTRVLLSIFFLLPSIVYAQTDSALRDEAIKGTLVRLESESASENMQDPGLFTQEINEATRIEFDKNTYLCLGLQIGYLKGSTAYDFDHHTSELEFPMDNVMGGGSFSLGYKNLSFNAEFWAPVDDYAGFQMKDKDWSNGVLISYTKSKAYMDAVICDANLQYDFYKKLASQESEDLLLSDEVDSALDNLKFDKIKIGVLLGYRYESFDFDMYDLWSQISGVTTHQGEKVLTYKIKHRLPYLGLAADLYRENCGLGIKIKYSFYPTARDVDNHLLRGLTFYGDYDKNGDAFFGSIYGFWEFVKDWKLKAGADGTFIRIDGKTWEDGHDPAWDKDQATDTRHWLFWSGIEYKF